MASSGPQRPGCHVVSGNARPDGSDRKPGVAPRRRNQSFVLARTPGPTSPRVFALWAFGAPHQWGGAMPASTPLISRLESAFQKAAGPRPHSSEPYYRRPDFAARAIDYDTGNGTMPPVGPPSLATAATRVYQFSLPPTGRRAYRESLGSEESTATSTRISEILSDADRDPR